MKYYIANWKANKNLQSAIDWTDQFLKIYQPSADVEVIICPPHPFLQSIKQKINLVAGLKLGAQNLSLFESGAYTGETTVKSVAGLVDYVILGHSERRKYFYETNQTVTQKIILANAYQIKPILCIRDEKDWLKDIPVNIVAFEPTEAIGSGNNESCEKVVQLREKIKLTNNTAYLYGGSVDENNAKDYLQSDKIDGLLIGSASLDPQSFNKIIG